MVEFEPLARARFLADAPVVLSGELELAPAAVVRGTLLGSQESRPRLELADGEVAGDFRQDLVLALEGGTGEPQTFVISFALSDLGEAGSGGFVLHAVRGLYGFSFDPGATLALMRVENGRPLPAPTAQEQVQPGQDFELKLAEEGDFVLLAFQEGKRPLTLPVKLRLREIVSLGSFALDPGAFVQGTLVSAPGAGECCIVATRQP